MEMDTLVTCSYDKSHRVATRRLPIHLRKCSKNHPDSDKIVCPYNAKHRVNNDQLNDHLINCANRSIIHPSVISDEKTQGPPYILPINPNQDAPGVDGAWDTGEWKDSTTGTYNAQLICEKRGIPINKIGLSKSRRKQHHQENRMRASQVPDSKCVNKRF